MVRGIPLPRQVHVRSCIQIAGRSDGSPAGDTRRHRRMDRLTDPRLYRPTSPTKARLIVKVPFGEAAEAFDGWVSCTRRCRIPAFREVAKEDSSGAPHRCWPRSSTALSNGRTESVTVTPDLASESPWDARCSRRSSNWPCAALQDRADPGIDFPRLVADAVGMSGQVELWSCRTQSFSPFHLTTHGANAGGRRRPSSERMMDHLTRSRFLQLRRILTTPT